MRRFFETSQFKRSAVEVAQSIGTERSTAYRMLSTLIEAGYVVRDSMRRYRLDQQRR